MELSVLFQELIAKFASEVIIALLLLLGTTVVAWLKTYRSAKERIREAEERVSRIQINGHEREGDGIWLSEPIQKPTAYDHMIRGSQTKIIAVGNLKGGVGKTTIASNFAAHFAMKRKERVLVIDADYQGSISSMMFQTKE